jgi:glutathione peroxidase
MRPQRPHRRRAAIAFALAAAVFAASPAEAAAPWAGAPLQALDGSAFAADQLQGKVVLFVNVASFCGFTKQYAGLQALYEAYASKGLVIVGVPCNQFGSQEPGSPAEIATFCRSEYGVTFPILEKQDVNGKERSPLYQQLIASPAGGGDDIKWNFEKFLVGRDGSVVARYGSRTAPDDAALKTAIEAALAAKP